MEIFVCHSNGAASLLRVIHVTFYLCVPMLFYFVLFSLCVVRFALFVQLLQNTERVVCTKMRSEKLVDNRKVIFFFLIKIRCIFINVLVYLILI